MSYTGTVLNHYFEILSRMKKGIFFHADDDFRVLQFQANTQAEVKEILEHFPGIIWSKRYNHNNTWWEYTATDGIYRLKIYGVDEAPATCRAITETKTVKVREPRTFIEYEEEQEVIVGWDCKQGED